VYFAHHRALRTVAHAAMVNIYRQMVEAHAEVHSVEALFDAAECLIATAWVWQTRRDVSAALR
jgi:hypothetical protein